jgi:hypothetical protein
MLGKRGTGQQYVRGGEENAVGGGERGDGNQEGLEEQSKEEERKIGELEARFKLRELKLLAQVESRFQMLESKMKEGMRVAPKAGMRKDPASHSAMACPASHSGMAGYGGSTKDSRHKFWKTPIYKWPHIVNI